MSKEPTIHELKTWPRFFEEVRTGRKTFEIRKDDRGFQVGDILHLREYIAHTGIYTGREVIRRVTYIARELPPLKDGFVAMSLIPVAPASGIERIAQERQRQIEKLRYDEDHDDQHKLGDLTSAAVAYAIHAWANLEKSCGWTKSQIADATLEAWWPWDSSLWKPSRNQVRNLEKAGALIAAEIDKLLRERV